MSRRIGTQCTSLRLTIGFTTWDIRRVDPAARDDAPGNCAPAEGASRLCVSVSCLSFRYCSSYACARDPQSSLKPPTRCSAMAPTEQLPFVDIAVRPARGTPWSSPDSSVGSTSRCRTASGVFRRTEILVHQTRGTARARGNSTPCSPFALTNVVTGAPLAHTYASSGRTCSEELGDATHDHGRADVRHLVRRLTAY